MRDEQILGMNADTARKVFAIYKQCRYLDTRLTAYEMLFENRKAILKAIWNPQWLRTAADAIQLELIKKHDEEIQESAKRAEEEAKKPKLTVVKSLAFILAFSLVSCVSIPTNKKQKEQSFNEGYAKANIECLDLQIKIRDYVYALQERLRKFNQLNEDGTLRSKKNDDSKGWDKNEGQNDEN